MTKGLMLRYVVVILAFASVCALGARAVHLTGVGYWLVAAFVTAGVALVVEHRTHG